MPQVSFTVGTGVSSVHWKLYSSANVLQLEGDVSNGGTFSRIHRAGMYVVISSVTPYSNYTTPYYYTRTDGYVQNLSSDNVISFSNSVTTKEGTITATYQAPSTYIVSYDANGGTGAPSAQTKTQDVDLTLSSTKPTRTGYDFLYWMDDYIHAQWSPGETYTFNRSVTLKAQWQLKTYTLAYNLDGGTGDSSTQTKTHGINITLHDAPTKTGYDFQYWQDQTNYSTWSAGANFTENRSTTFKAIWSRKTYTVSYNANGGSGAPSAQTKTYGINLILSSTIPTRTGYDFINWFDGTDYYNPGGTYTANSSANLYAQWQLKTYTVSYDANGGSRAPSAQTKTHDVDLTLSSTKPLRTGYDFLYWMDDYIHAQWSPGETYTFNRSVTLKAQWQLKTYTVSYDANGGTDAPSAQTKYYGQNLILTTDEPTRTGYNFINWFDGTDYYSPGGMYTANSSTTLYAQWNRKKYTISYNANGGSGAPSSQIKEYGIALTLSSVEPTWSGHIFLYWQDQGTDYHIWYPGDSFDRDRDTTLTAIWKTACDLFYWHGSASADSSKFASGEPVKDALTAAAWNRAIDKTNEVRELLEQSATTIPKVTAGSQITAVTFNQLRLAIGSTIGAGTLPAEVDKGDIISISLFIGSGSLREALNEAINNYNNSK